MHTFGAMLARHLASDQCITRRKMHLFEGICKNPPHGPPCMARLILDSGAIIALAAGNERVRRFVQWAVRERILAVIPAVVIAETTRGGARDAPVNRVITLLYCAWRHSAPHVTIASGPLGERAAERRDQAHQPFEPDLGKPRRAAPCLGRKTSVGNATDRRWP
jgi:hypothetical protein